MSCVGNTCGTGGWGGPLPGDPSNDITLSANGGYGGINLVWSIPSTNGFAVSYVNVHRGTSNDLEAAVKIGIDTDGHYFDATAPNILYYYWIQVISINGTFSEPIGPVSASSRPAIEQTLEELTGKIDEGKLAQTLKDSISGITLNNQAIYKEIQDRLDANVALQTALTAVKSTADTALTYTSQEIIDRKSADSALVSSIETIAAGLGSNAAAITTEATVRAAKDEALAQTINTLFVEGGPGYGAIIEERSARIDADEVIVNSIDLLGGRVDQNQAAISDVMNLTINETSALAQRLTQLAANAGNAAAAVNELSQALADGSHALAQKVTTVESSLNGIATVQTGLTTDINTLTGALDAMYFAKVQVNGLIGGFGVWNSGTTVQAGFDVDSFWVGRTNDEKVKPFIIDNGIVYMDVARIRDADIGTLKIAGNAVTTSVSAFTNGFIETYPDSNPVIQTLTFTSSGYPVALHFGAAVVPPMVTRTVNSDGDTATFVGEWTIELYRNDSLLVSLPNVRSFMFLDTPPPGVMTYKMRLNTNNSTQVPGVASATKRSIYILETKR